jgi:hypothetical protein
MECCTGCGFMSLLSRSNMSRSRTRRCRASGPCQYGRPADAVRRSTTITVTVMCENRV